MKKLLFFVVMIAGIANGQNYRNICNQGITFYKNSNHRLEGFRRDSILFPGGNDSVFLSYRSIIDTGATWGKCADTSNGSILGRKIYSKGNGWFYFFNRNNDSVRINSQADVNDAWRFVELSNGSYIQATVTGIVTDSVLGTTDQVKVISFQAKDVANNNIEHVLNQRCLKLSRHYGLTQMLHVYYIPDDTTLYFLAGKSNPPAGIQEINWRNIYDFNINDAFHYSGWGYSPASSAVWTRRELIIGKTVYGNNDSVTYQVERCVKVQGGPPPFTNTWVDTLTVKYNFVQMANDASFFKLPGELFDNGYWANQYYRKAGAIGQRQTKGISLDVWSNTGSSHTCWSKPYPDSYKTIEYTEGLGVTYNHENYDWEHLEYYKKGNETWGTPVTNDCGIQLGKEPETESKKLFLQVIPNPVENKAEVILSHSGSLENLTYRLYNSSGKGVAEGNAESGSFSLDRRGLSGGIYLLVIRDKNGMILGSNKIIFR
jgi:hypothetical protein